jgi:hypothetical protein
MRLKRNQLGIIEWYKASLYGDDVCHKSVEQTGNVATTFRCVAPNYEQDFKVLGLSSFFDIEEDNSVDWEEVFDVKNGLNEYV